MIQKVPVDYFEEARGGDVRQLEGIGDYAYVGPHAFGRIATARTAEAGYLVVGAESINDDALVDLLAAFVERGAAVVVDNDGSDLGSGEEPPTGDWAPGTDDCPLTTEAVSEVMGRPMVPASGSCSWTAESAPATELYEVYFNPLGIELFSLIDGTRVEDVGDEAFDGDFGTIYVRVGERAFSLQVLAFGAGPEFPGSSPASEALARHAADALR